MRGRARRRRCAPARAGREQSQTRRATLACGLSAPASKPESKYTNGTARCCTRRTAVADGHLGARRLESNLNLASWLTNCEIDVAIEDEGFATRMSVQYPKPTSPTRPRLSFPHAGPRQCAARNSTPESTRRVSGSSEAVRRRGTLRLCQYSKRFALGNRRVLGSADAGLLPPAALFLVIAAVLGALWPRLIAWPLALLALWIGVSLLLRYQQLRRARDALGATRTPE